MKVVLSGADSGSLKAVEFDHSVDTSNPDSKQPYIDCVVPSFSVPKKANAITHICTFERFTAIARLNGNVLIGEKLLHDMAVRIVGFNQAVVSVGSNKKQKRRNALIVTAATGNSRVIVFDKDGSVVSSIEFRLRDGLSAVVNNPNSTLMFASAGAEALPDVFKLAIAEDSVEVEQIWSAETLPNDYLDLPVPNLVSALAFVDKTRVVAVTSKGALRLYDTEQERQPIASTQVSKYALKCVAVDAKNPGTVIVGDANTLVSRWSLEPLKLLGSYKGVIGSTRSISVRGDYVAIGGLDRYLRVFHITKRQLAGKVYIGDEIWALELLRTDEEESMSDMDNMWDELEPKRRKMDTKSAEDSGSESPFEGFDD